MGVLGGCGEVLKVSHFFIEAKLVDEGLLSFGGVGELGEGAFSPVDFDSVDAFGLDFAELVDAAVEGVLGGGAGSFDGAELFFIHGVEEGVEGGAVGDVAIGEVAAAKAPGGAGDLVGEGVFEEAGGAEFLEHGVEEVFVEGGFVGEDKIVSCEES